MHKIIFKITIKLKKKNIYKIIHKNEEIEEELKLKCNYLYSLLRFNKIIKNFNLLGIYQ